MSEEEDYSSLPLEERLVHKLWKARLEAYQEITKQFENSPNEHSDVFKPYFNHPETFKKIITDSNVVAQEQGIIALNALLEFGGCQLAIRLRHHIVPGLCEKGLSSSRAVTKQKSIDAILWFVELDTPDPVIELMISSLSAKLPKLVAGTIKAISEIYSQFGAQTVSPKLILPNLPRLFSHADRNVRLETSNLTVELYKWLGPSLEQILFTDLKPVQQKDLTKLFEKTQNEKPTQKRFLKSQQDAIESLSNENEGLIDGDTIMGNNEEATGPIDPYDLMDPVSILNKLPSDLATKCSAVKWKDRVETLTEVYNELKPVIKFADDDYAELIRILAKGIKDVNIQVASLAANSIECLAKGLRKRFHKYYTIVLNPLLERLKEKKPSVLDALNGALDSVFNCTSLSDILEEVLEFLKHKTPQVRLSSSKFLIRCLKETKEAPNKTEIENIITISIKLVNDTLPDVRNVAFELVGTLMKITGERELNSYLEHIDDLKKKKIIEFYEIAEVKAKLSNKPKSKPIAKSQAKPATTLKKKPINRTPSTTLPPKKPSASASTIPSKRGPTSPLKSTATSRIGSINRGLTSRSLQSSSSTITSQAAVKETVLINDEEKEELNRLRREKANWLEEKEKFKNQMTESMKESSNFIKDIELLQNKIEKLNEQRTNDIMTIKTKDTQIQRFQSDLEISRLKINQLETEIELLQRNKSYESNPLHESNNNNFSTRFSTEFKPEPITELDKRVSTLSIDPETKENPVRSSIQFDTSDDSWRRAAEVTSQLKARIEKMKAKSRNSYRNGI